jgi:hypothetical protein
MHKPSLLRVEQDVGPINNTQKDISLNNFFKLIAPLNGSKKSYPAKLRLKPTS